MTTNGKKAVFNSKYASKEENLADRVDSDYKDDSASTGLSLVYDKHSGYVTQREDPEYSQSPKDAKRAAKSYIKSLAPGEQPHPDAVSLFGLKKNRLGQWSHDRGSSRLANVNTLADYAETPVIPKARSGMTGYSSDFRFGVKPNLTIGDGILAPHMHIGYKTNEESGEIEPITAGEYQSRGKKYTAQPVKTIGAAKQYREGLIERLFNSGRDVTGKDYWEEVHKPATLLTHGRRITENDPATEGSENKNWHGFGPEGSPLHAQLQINPVVQTMCNHTILDHEELGREEDVVKRFGEGSASKKALKSLGELKASKAQLLEDGKTANFVMCHCPHCAVDQQANGFNSIFDMQHHQKAATHEDKKIREAYFKGYPVPIHSELGRISDLGPVGKLCHHRTFAGTASYNRFVSHILKFHKERKEGKTLPPIPTFRGTSTGAGIGVQFDPLVMSRRLPEVLPELDDD